MSFFRRFFLSRSRSVALPSSPSEILARLTELDQEVRQLTKSLKPEKSELAAHCELLSEIFRRFPESFNPNTVTDRDREDLDFAIADLGKVRSNFASGDPLVTRLASMAKLAAWFFQRAKDFLAVSKKISQLIKAGKYKQAIPLLERELKLDPSNENTAGMLELMQELVKQKVTARPTDTFS